MTAVSKYLRDILQIDKIVWNEAKNTEVRTHWVTDAKLLRLYAYMYATHNSQVYLQCAIRTIGRLKSYCTYQLQPLRQLSQSPAIHPPFSQHEQRDTRPQAWVIILND